MKKITALALCLILACSLIACGSQTNTPSGGNNNHLPSVPDDDYNPRDPDEYLYGNVFANSPHKAKWDTGNYGADLYGIWDSSVLPSVFPAEPNSVTSIDRTSFVGKLDKKLGEHPPGQLWTDSETADWEYFYVMFEGTEATFNTLKEALEANFECVDEPENDYGGESLARGDFHAYSQDWYMYMSYYEDGDWDDAANKRISNGTWGFTLYAIPAYHQLPKVIEGVPLPQFGYMMSPANELICYADGDDEYTWLDYDYQTGTASGTVKTYWDSEELLYYGATESDAEAYGQTLLSAGFSNTYNGSEQYYKTYKKDDVSVYVSYNAKSKYVAVRVNSGENWY